MWWSSNVSMMNRLIFDNVNELSFDVYEMNDELYTLCIRIIFVFFSTFLTIILSTLKSIVKYLIFQFSIFIWSLTWKQILMSFFDLYNKWCHFSIYIINENHFNCCLMKSMRKNFVKTFVLQWHHNFECFYQWTTKSLYVFFHCEHYTAKWLKRLRFS
jgi:hypothetical protein